MGKVLRKGPGTEWGGSSALVSVEFLELVGREDGPSASERLADELLGRVGSFKGGSNMGLGNV